MIKVEIHCDECNEDITHTGNSIDYRIKVCSEVIPCHDGTVTDMMIYPQFASSLHFCSLGCLREWSKKNI